MTDIRKIDYSSADYRRACQIRELYLRKPLGLALSKSDLDGEESQTHFAAFDNDKMQGCVIIRQFKKGVFKLRQMVVIPGCRGAGIGAMLINRAEAHIRLLGGKAIELAARKESISFYIRCGYHIQSDEFDSLGIPHYLMSKKL